jgi:hypothetical protein
MNREYEQEDIMTAKWTWLVYMAGDNNLEGAAPADLAEMAQAGSTSDVNILVELDTEEKKTYRYRIDKGNKVALQTLPGINTGDPAALTDFIKWGAKVAPADHYALVVWNHGGGFEDLPFDYNAMRSMRPAEAGRTLKLSRSLFRSTKKTIAARNLNERAIALDCGSRDYLDNQELRLALEQSGVRLDLFGCDACLMNMLEIGYEMRSTANVMVGSEEVEPGAGWDYKAILTKLVQSPTLPAPDLAKLVTTSYAEFYKKHPAGGVTMSAVDLTKIVSVANLVDQLGAALCKTMASSHTAIGAASNGALTFETPDYVDLGDFALRLSKTLPQGSAAATSANAVLAALAPSAGFVLEKASRGTKMAKATGVSVFFPSPKSGIDPHAMLADYNKLQIVRDYSGWSQMIAAYLEASLG